MTTTAIADRLGRWTGHEDTFVLERLPAPETQPDFLFDLPELQYPAALNAGEALIDGAIDRGWGDRRAFVTEDGDWTYQEVLALTNQLANVLVNGLRVRPGGRVLLRGGNSPQLYALWLAILKAGAVAIATMPMLRAGELLSVVEKGAVTLAVSDFALLEELQIAAGVKADLTVISFESLVERAQTEATDFTAARTHRDDPCLLAFTSGTTGQPKACVHYHRDVMAMCDTFARYVLKPNQDDVFAATPPIAFTFGLGGALVFPLRCGAATSFLKQSGVKHLLEHIASRGVSVLFTAPTSYRQMLTQPEADFSSLRRCVCAGEALDELTTNLWFERTGLRLIDGIGSTEMMHIFISASDEDVRPGSTGRPVPGFRAMIMDEDGGEAPDGDAGPLAVKGPTGCRYLDDARQAVYVSKGWNVTGDTFRRDAEGYYWFVGRSDDMIISSGYNIAAPEVEAALLAHPAVAECVVVAQPDPVRGHIPKAFIVLKSKIDDEIALIAELQSFVKSTIAPYKYPRAIAFVGEIPKTATGKVMRFKLREQSR